MRRLLPVIPLILLILLNACKSPTTPTGGVFLTFTPTIGPPPTPTIDGSTIVAQLNRIIEETETANSLDQLEHAMSARYQVLDVSFPVESDGTTSFQVDVNCECAANGQCCSYEQTFVETIRVIYADQGNIVTQVPGTIKYMKVLCYDHSSQLDVMYVSWDEAKKFFSGQLTGYQLASRVHHN